MLCRVGQDSVQESYCREETMHDFVYVPLCRAELMQLPFFKLTHIVWPLPNLRPIKGRKSDGQLPNRQEARGHVVIMSG